MRVWDSLGVYKAHMTQLENTGGGDPKPTKTPKPETPQAGLKTPKTLTVRV